MAWRLAVLWPDTHEPYSHAKAVALALNVISDLSSSLDEIVFLGDFADFYAVNSHGKHPGMMHLLVDEVDKVNFSLDLIDSTFPRVRKVFLEGNHEFRLERYLINVAPALFGVTDLNFLFRFNQRPGWTVIPYGPEQRFRVLGSNLHARHEPLASSAAASLKQSMCNLTYGHIHRIESATHVTLPGKTLTNFSVGWLGDCRKKEVFGYVKGHHRWNLGFGLVWVDTETNEFYAQTVPIHSDITCVVNGKRYRA